MSDQTTDKEAADRTPEPPKVLALLDNLFFAAKINQAAARFGVQTVYAKSAEKALELARTSIPTLILVDLDAVNCAPLQLIAQLKAEQDTVAIPVIGFVSHINVDIQEAARQAGCDQIMARSVFDRNLSTLLNQLS